MIPGNITIKYKSNTISEMFAVQRVSPHQMTVLIILKTVQNTLLISDGTI